MDQALVKAKIGLPAEERAALRVELKNEFQSILATDVITQIEQKFSANIIEDRQIEQFVKTDRNVSTSLASAAPAISVEPKDIADLLEKIGKILNVGAPK